MRRTAPSHLLVVSAAALLGFGYTASLVARRRTERADNQARDELQAAVPVLASCVSELLNRLVTHTLHIRVVPPGHPEYHTQKPSFPSGHAMETTAVALASAYGLAREEIVRAAPAFAGAGLLDAASTVGRLVLDRQWVTDAVGGSLLGVAVAAASASAYEAMPS